MEQIDIIRIAGNAGRVLGNTATQAAIVTWIRANSGLSATEIADFLEGLPLKANELVGVEDRLGGTEKL